MPCIKCFNEIIYGLLCFYGGNDIVYGCLSLPRVLKHLLCNGNHFWSESHLFVKEENWSYVFILFCRLCTTFWCLGHYIKSIAMVPQSWEFALGFHLFICLFEISVLLSLNLIYLGFTTYVSFTLWFL